MPKLHKKALIVGIDNYPSQPLCGCVNDATSIANILETDGNGDPNFEVQLKTDIQSKSNFKTLIAELFKGKSDIETALFYFSGHGFLNEIGGYLVTPDYSKYDEGISMYEILALANISEVQNKIIILDCCHAGTMGIPMINNPISQLSEGVTILTASRGDELSIEINGHGVFTNLLLDALNGGAADLRGNISPGSVYAYIDQALGEFYQRPVFKTNVSRFTSLRWVEPQISDVTLRKIKDLFPDPNDHFSLDPSYEETNSKDIKHEIIEPFADPENVKVFKQLQKLQSVGLVVAVDAPFMYFAAMNSKACKLTPLGQHYWRLAKDRRI